MSWRVLSVATISLWAILLVMEVWSWLILLLVPVITILILLVIIPCIINCLTHFVSAQVNKLQHAVPVQQGYIKLHLATENISHPEMDTTIRTLRLDTSKRGRPNAPRHPRLAARSQETLMSLFPQDGASHLLRRES